MGESDAGVVFQGEGDPLEATAVVLETVRLVAPSLGAALIAC